MIRKKLIKSLSLALATMLAIMTVACGAKKDSVSDAANAGVSTTAEEDKLSDSLAKSIGSSDDAGKVETVYVNADASGAANDIIVSEWLKNAGATDELADKTELKELYDISSGYMSIRQWLDAIDEEMEASEVSGPSPDGDKDGVSVLTLHASKGLEFHEVFILDRKF